MRVFGNRRPIEIPMRGLSLMLGERQNDVGYLGWKRMDVDGHRQLPMDRGNVLSPSEVLD